MFLPALMYDAVFAWAHAVNKTLELGIVPGPKDSRKFGREVAKQLNHLDFDGQFALS